MNHYRIVKWERHGASAVFEMMQILSTVFYAHKLNAFNRFGTSQVPRGCVLLLQ